MPLNLAAESSSAKKLEAVRSEISELDKTLSLNKKTKAELQQQLKKQSLKVSEKSSRQSNWRH